MESARRFGMTVVREPGELIFTDDINAQEKDSPYGKCTAKFVYVWCIPGYVLTGPLAEMDAHSSDAYGQESCAPVIL